MNYVNDIRWRDIREDESYLDHPDETLLVQTNITLGTGCREVRAGGIDMFSHISNEIQERVLFYAYRNMTN